MTSGRGIVSSVRPGDIAFKDPPPRAPGRDRSQRRQRVFALRLRVFVDDLHLWGYSYDRTAAPRASKRDDGDTDCDGGGSRTLLVPPRPLTSIRWSLTVVRRKRPERT